MNRVYYFGLHRVSDSKNTVGLGSEPILLLVEVGPHAPRNQGKGTSRAAAELKEWFRSSREALNIRGMVMFCHSRDWDSSH